MSIAYTASFSDVLKERVRNYIINECNVTTCFENDTKLFSLGLLDSFSIIAMISWIETEFSITIEVDIVTMENFESINSIAELIQTLIKK